VTATADQRILATHLLDQLDAATAEAFCGLPCRHGDGSDETCVLRPGHAGGCDCQDWHIEATL
jgi:hypothetical protein